MTNLKIEVGKMYVTKDGTVKVDGKKKHPGTELGLHAEVVVAKRHFHRFYREDEILREATWRDLIPWEAIHPDYNWIAWLEGKNGNVILTCDRPRANKEFGDWLHDSKYTFTSCLNLPTPDCPWYETATERPKKNGI